LNVLIEGESGTGKELFAQAIHNQSNRRKGPFVAINCGAIPRELIGSELFGYAEGAFSGAKKGGNPGKFELASGGTLFLDEIGDMPFEQQVSLLRVIQEKKVTRIGSNQVVPVDVRIICASNKKLLDEIQKGNFRHDLYYRLNVVQITVPPLREHAEDIPELFQYFLAKIDEQWANDIQNMTPEVMKYLAEYNWPGNVRELENVVDRMYMMAAGNQITPEHLPLEICCPTPVEFLSSGLNSALPSNNTDSRGKMKALINQVETDEIKTLLSKHRGNISKIARELGVSRNTVYRKIKQNDIHL
jgi:sigma-54 dependent transcriptional regulator, acetoin dehydrogenase operon transcriptional activator AcoR